MAQDSQATLDTKGRRDKQDEGPDEETINHEVKAVREEQIVEAVGEKQRRLGRRVLDPMEEERVIQMNV